MKTRNSFVFLTASLFLLSLALIAAKQADFIKTTFQQTVSAKGIHNVSVINTSGDVEIIGKKSGPIEISAIKKVFYRDRRKAEEFMDKIQIIVKPRAGTLQIRTIPPREDWRKYYRKRVSGYRVEYKIVMPEHLQGEIENRYGDVSVLNIKSLLSENHSGNTYVERINGDAELSNSYGKMSIESVAGDLTSNNKSGNTTAKKIAGTADIKNSYGNVRLSRVGQNAKIDNKSGNVDATSMEQGLEISNSYGSVYVEDVTKSLIVNNKSGSLEAINIGGNADLATSYDRILCQQIGGQAKIVNKSGSVRAEEIKGKVTIETSYNSVKAIKIGGPVTVLNRSGSVYLERVTGDVNVESSYNTIELEAISGSAEVENHSGKIIARGISGNFRGTTSYNAVILFNVTGDVYVKNKSGSITVSGKCRSLDLATSYARIKLSRLTCKKISAQTRNGNIDADLTLTANGECYLETSYGDIDLTIPATTSAKISATVPKGNRIRIERGVTLTITQMGKEKVTGRIGDGRGKIELLIVRSGNINLGSKE